MFPANKFAVTALAEVLRHEFNQDNFQFKVTVWIDGNFIGPNLLRFFYDLQSVSPGAVRTEIAGEAFSISLPIYNRRIFHKEFFTFWVILLT